MATAVQDTEAVLAKEIGQLCDDPEGFAEFAYAETPRPWQREILKLIGKHLQGDSWSTPLKIAVASGHGIGKSALVAMIIDWAMSTCDDCKVIVTANTGTQLSTKTVPETHKWFGRSINAHWWELKATSITIRNVEHSRRWRTDFIPWSVHNTEAFAGAHNKGKRIVVIFDEASAIEDPVWEVAEGALTDENTEIIWLAFGNPTQNTGRFRECFGRFKHRWHTFQIDSRTVEGTNKQQLDRWVEDYGEDSDFVRVRVRGEFPRAGSAQFIPSDIVEIARKYKAEGYGALPKVLAVDVARFGDDESVMGLRQGRKFEILGKFRGKDTAWVANETIRHIQESKPDATVIDADGIGAGVFDLINHRGFGTRLYEFHGGASANDATSFYNRRAEVWGSIRDWLLAGAEIPNDAELAAQLTGPEYAFSNKGQIQLEKKEDMKLRGLDSPDMADCLAMTFGVTVMPKPKVDPKPQWGSDMGQSWMS